MQPALRVGDLVIDTVAPPSSIKLGDIISYASLADSSAVITHRVINIDREKNYFITQGDNLSSADPPVRFNQVLGKRVQTVPAIGYGLDSLRTPLGLLGIVYVPVLFLAIAEFKHIASRFNRPYKIS